MRILGRRTGFLDLVLLGFALYGGYCAYHGYKEPYSLEQEHGSYYLVKKSTDQKKLITGNFQLGSLEYRLKGVLEDGKDNVRRALERTAKEYNLGK